MNTTTDTLTFTDLARKAVEIADASPDFIYVPPPPLTTRGPRCAYANPDGTGSCLFGQAMIALGATGLARETTGGIINVAPLVGFVETGTPADRMLLRYALGSAQGNQDAGMPWGQAVWPLRRFVSGASE